MALINTRIERLWKLSMDEKSNQATGVNSVCYTIGTIFESILNARTSLPSPTIMQLQSREQHSHEIHLADPPESIYSPKKRRLECRLSHKL